MEGFEGLTEEQLQQLIELGIIPDQQNALSEQAAQANAIRNRAGPEMRGNGRVMVAANPLEFLADAGMKYKAGKDLKEIDTKRETLLDKQVMARKALLDALRGGGAGITPGGIPQAGAPYGGGGFA
jgi:hypothetical protein